MTNSLRKTLKPHWISSIRMLVFLVSVQFIFSYTVLSQSVSVSGKVTDAQTGEGIPGATVSVKGTATGTVTNVDGTYRLNVPAQNSVLVFSFIGFTTQEIQLNGKTAVDVALEMSTTQLDEVVAVGYGTARRADLTGSVASLSGDELKKIPITNAAEAIKGRLPGVNVITTDGSPDAEVVIRVRGGGSVTQDNSPLYVVDGFIVGSIRDIPPGDIASINVLKDAAATAIYGAQAANGVILITTKSPTEGKTSISYNGYAQFKTLPAERKYDVLDPYEYVMANYELAKLRSTADLNNFQKYFGKYEDLELYKYKKPTDWQDEMFGDSQVSWSHNVSMSGGTDKTKLSLSFSNNSDDGIMVGNDYIRNVINFKLNHEISKTLDFEGSARITDTKV
ncbi:MAG TPA: SusC/RagA family TonB-linked outer membrane protein, partial [Draconibacterium sp.]|nr:SusC/RagA family TonB-linked outer membrane protein [Draconibacterium sp.]